jgi:septal ring-binding cell division protein DamX
METPQYVGSSALRMILAVTVFLGLSVIAVLMLTNAPGSIKQKINKSKTLASSEGTTGPKTTEATREAFFYDVIGQAPADFEAPGERGAVKGPHTKVSYTLELKVATSREEAEQLIDLLKDQGVDAYYTPLTRAGRVVYRVRRGIFTRAKDAKRAMIALKDEHNLSTKVVKLQ